MTTKYQPFLRPLLVIFLFISTSLNAQTSLIHCDSEITKAVQDKMKTFQSIYEALDTKSGGIREQNQSLYLSGTNGKAVIIQHGFIASPFEVMSAVQYLHDKGYSVYAPLLFGFGSSAKVANSITRQDWKNDFSENISILRKCYEKITLIGFSIGATLALDYAYQHSKEVESLILISPYYDVSDKMLESLNRYANLFTDEISVKFLYGVSRNNDLNAIINNPQFYNQKFPLNSSSQAIELGKQIQSDYLNSTEYNKQQLSLPNLTIFSESDKTIKQSLVAKIPASLFNQSVVHPIGQSFQVPHQVLLPDSNPLLKNILEIISSFMTQEHDKCCGAY